MKIDAHHHFWNYDPIRYSWMNDRMDILKRDYQPSDLQAEIERTGIDGVVSVQADQSMLETDELLEHAPNADFIKGVVGGFPWPIRRSKKHCPSIAKPMAQGVRHEFRRAG